MYRLKNWTKEIKRSIKRELEVIPGSMHKPERDYDESLRRLVMVSGSYYDYRTGRDIAYYYFWMNVKKNAFVLPEEMTTAIADEWIMETVRYCINDNMKSNSYQGHSSYFIADGTAESLIAEYRSLFSLLSDKVREVCGETMSFEEVVDTAC